MKANIGIVKNANTLFNIVEYVEKIGSAFCLYISRRDFTWTHIKKMHVKVPNSRSS